MIDAPSQLVLVVEDFAPARFVKARALRNAGYQVAEADTGAGALALVRTVEPDIVVLDMKLPDMDGYELCRQLKADPQSRSIQVLQTSATFVEDADRVRGLAGGADSYLTEPVSAAVLVATVDVLARVRQAERTLQEVVRREQEARRAAEDANRVKDEFLATLSHELRTPLNAILGWSQLLLRDQLDEATRRDGVQAIARNARAQHALVNDMLDLARIVTGKVRLSVAPMDLVDVLQAAVDSMQPAVQAKRLSLETALPPSAQLVGDGDRLQQIFWNLLSNAVKFTPEGGRVRLELQPHERDVTVSVSDTGIGIAPDFLPRVFDRFTQSDSSVTRSHAGLGLGLAIVRHLVELHGGTVAAASTGRDQGATFTVTLPVGDIHEARERPTAAVRGASPAAAPSRSLVGVRVMVVEDDADSRALLAAALAAYGAEVIPATSAAEALDLLQRMRPYVLISDIAMAGVDGYELMRRIRALAADQGGETPALALTAHGREEDRVRAMDAGYQRHVAKPVVLDELAAIVADLAAARV